MFKINDIELRNLEEQVQKNKEDIANHYAIDRTLANFGITIVGQASSVSQLPDPLTYTGEYGYAYAVGTSGNYKYYIFTRPDPDSGHPTNYWLDVGALSIVGPEGPQGPVGPQGPKGEASQWYALIDPSNPKMNDMKLETDGDVYQYLDAGNYQGWVYFTNIKGPQGIQGPRGLTGAKGDQGEQGPKGETGDVGGLVNILGILTNESQLPSPSSINNLSFAYLVGTTKPYNLYVQIGETPETALWTDLGPLNVATMVTVNGQYQNTWEADTKVDKFTGPYDTFMRVYGTNLNGTPKIFKASYNTNQYGNVVLYTYSDEGTYLDDGSVRNSSTGAVVTAIPKLPGHATPKKWVEDKLALKLNAPGSGVSSSAPGYVLGQSSTTDKSTYRYKVASTTGNNSKNAIAKYNNSGNLVSGTPTNTTDVANKQYVDDELTKKVTVPEGIPGNKCVIGYNQGSAEPRTFTMGSYTSGSAHRGSIAIYGTNGCLASPTPINGEDVATKQYVDDKFGKIWFHTFSVVDMLNTTDAETTGYFYATTSDINLLTEDGRGFKVSIEDAKKIISPIVYSETKSGQTTTYVAEPSTGNYAFKSKTFDYDTLTLPNEPVLIL